MLMLVLVALLCRVESRSFPDGFRQVPLSTQHSGSVSQWYYSR
jgi:hypothetical protein